MIIVTYELRPRLFVEPTNNDYIEWYKMLNKNSFTSWLQKQGIGPENTAGNEHEEGERLREEIEARTTPDADAYDHQQHGILLHPLPSLTAHAGMCAKSPFLQLSCKVFLHHA